MLQSSEDSDVELATSGHGRDARSGPAGRIVNTSLLRDTNTVDMENTFMVHISIERAYHLPHIPDARYKVINSLLYNYANALR